MNRQLFEKLLDCALSTGADFAEIFYEDRVNNQINVEKGITQNVLLNRINGVGIRLHSGLSEYYVYTNDLKEESLIKAAKKAASAVKSNKILHREELEKLHEEKLFDIQIKPSDVKVAEKIKVLKSMNKAAMSIPVISQCLLTYKDSTQNVIIANSEGRFVEDTRYYTRLLCSAVASKDGKLQTASQNPGAHKGFEFINDIDYDEVALKAANIAATMVDAPDCPAGRMPVIIGNDFGGVIFHEACGHSLEASSVAYGNSEFCGKLNEQIAAKCVTAIEDGTLANEWGSINIDDEGTKTTKLVLIENGILKNYMIDRLNSIRMNMPVTGSARRESYKYAPTSRMRNTFIAAGNDDEEEMFSTMGDGLFAKTLGGGSVNTSTGEFNFAVTEGYLVKGGKIVHPVRGASLIGKGSEVLMLIDRVGKNLKHAQGMCGSSSGSVPTNVGQPYIRVKEMVVGGVSK